MLKHLQHLDSISEDEREGKVELGKNWGVFRGQGLLGVRMRKKSTER
jgi:hypothetical protein